MYVIIDYIFKFALLFTLNLIWCLYFFRTTWISIKLSFLFTFFAILIYKLISLKKTKNNNPKLQEIQHIEDIKNTFIYLPQDKVIDFFYCLVSTKHKATKQDNYVEVLNEQKVILYPYFKIQELSCDRLIEIYNSIDKTDVKKIIIVCNKYETNINSCITNFPCKTTILDYKQTYSLLLKPYEFYPEIIIKQKTKTKSNFKQIILSAFNKKKTKGYVVSALFMLFASFFVMYKIYYLIVASILLVFAIICQFEFKFNKTQKEELF